MAGEICPNKGDMSECDKKPRCKWGECEGQSLPANGEYCDSGYEYRPDYCDCQPVESYRSWRFFYDYYGSGINEVGIQCCQGYSLGNKSELDTYRDFGMPVFLTGKSSLGNTKLGWPDAEGVYNYCRANEELTYADAGYSGFYVESGPFGSFGSYVPADQKVYQQAGASGGNRSRLMVEAQSVNGTDLFLYVGGCGSGAVACTAPDCHQNVVAVPYSNENPLELLYDKAVSL